MTIATTCPGCGVMGGCICHTNAARPLFPIPEEPAVHLPQSPSAAYRQGWREGWAAGWHEAHKEENDD